MALTIGDEAPDFEADTTEGRIKFHDWIGDSWAVLFSHPKDFTPVCTTELGYMANAKPEFDRRGSEDHRPVGRRGRPTTSAGRRTSRRPRGPRPTTRSSATPTSRSPSSTGCSRRASAGTPKERTPADNQTVRNVFVIGPDKKIKLILVYPMTTGRNFDEVLRVIDSLQLTAKHKVATPVNWKQGEDVIIAGSVSNDAGQRGATRTAGRSPSPTSGSSRNRRELEEGSPVAPAPGARRRATSRGANTGPAAGHPFELVEAAVLERERAADDGPEDGARGEHFAGGREAGEAGGDVDGHPADVLADQLALAGVDPDPDLELELVHRRG